jgi:ketosteroid isomerase-like protein
VEAVTDLQAAADRVEITALQSEFTDAGMMRDYDRLVSLFTPDGVMRWPHVPIEFTGQEEMRASIVKMRSLWEFFVQHAHPGAIELDGDTAVGRTYIEEFGRFKNGDSHLNYSIYHDRYQRTENGWKFAERVYEVRYMDTTPLPGSVPDPATTR